MIKVETIVVTPFAQNCRILADQDRGKAVVIDPGGDISLVERELKKHACTCAQIWLTHSHIDHCGGVAALLRSHKADLLAHPVEKMMRSHIVELCDMYGIPRGLMENCPEPTRLIKGGERLEWGGKTFEVRFTPGHSPGHVVFYESSSDLLIAGDTLFAGSIGRTDLPGGDHETLLKSIREQIFSLPDSTRVLSGHGEETTVGYERLNNPFLQE